MSTFKTGKLVKISGSKGAGRNPTQCKLYGLASRAIFGNPAANAGCKKLLFTHISGIRNEICCIEECTWMAVYLNKMTLMCIIQLNLRNLYSRAPELRYFYCTFIASTLVVHCLSPVAFVFFMPHLDVTLDRGRRPFMPLIFGYFISPEKGIPELTAVVNIPTVGKGQTS